MFEFFIQNDLITPNQSGFKTGDSCINQLISITHEIYKSFDDGYEVRGVFLDISKAFDKVWHQGLHYKLRQNGISGEILNVLTDFLGNRTQRVILNGQYSSWAKVEAEVPQGSILEPLLFLIYINDLSENLVSNPKKFPDDTSIFSVVKHVGASNIDLNNDLKKEKWMDNGNAVLILPNKHKNWFFVAKCKQLIILLYFEWKFSSPNHPSKAQTTLQKYLAMFLDSKLNFSKPLKTIFQKTNYTIGLLYKLQTLLPRAPLITTYKSLIRPLLDYGDMINN